MLRSVVLPEALPALVAGGGLVLLLSLNEFGIVLFTGAKDVVTPAGADLRPGRRRARPARPPSWRTLPVTVFTLSDRGDAFLASASTVVLLVTTGLLLLAIGRLRTRAS